MFFQDALGWDPACNHRRLDDLAFGKCRSGRHAAADDRAAEEAFAPKPASFFDTLRDILARAEYEQEIGGLDRRPDQMLFVDFSNFLCGRQSAATVLHDRLSLQAESRTRYADVRPSRSHDSLRTMSSFSPRLRQQRLRQMIEGVRARSV